MKKLPVFALILALVLAGILFLIHSKSASAATNHIVISQIQISGTSANDEFVEIYNPTNNPVNLSKWKLTRKNSSGSEGNLVASLSGTLSSHQYFLIASASYSGAVVKDFTYSNNSNNLTNNFTVLIYNDTGVLTDKVGFGSAVDFETSDFPTNPVAGGSIQRKTDETGGHGLDTDNNSTDFEALAVSTPRNSSIVVLPTDTPTPTPTMTVSPTPTLEPSPTPTLEPSATPTPTLEPSTTPMPTDAPSPSPSPSPEPSATPTPSMSPTGEPSPTISPSPQPSSTPTPTPTLTPSPTPTIGGTIIVNSPHLVCTLTKKSFDFFFFKLLLPTVVCVRI